MNIVGASHNKIIRTVLLQHPEARDKVVEAQSISSFIKRQIAEDQGVVLYAMAKQFNKARSRILEIGTAWGYSAAVMAKAAPKSKIITLNPKEHEVTRARRHLAGLKNIQVVQETSDDYFNSYSGEYLDMVFVDGQHTPTAIYQDIRWFNWLRPGGLIFFHDYSPEDSGRPVQGVFNTLNEIADNFRPFDELIVDHRKIGVCGWYRQPNEVWNNGG